jgi:hypothetical protein
MRRLLPILLAFALAAPVAASARPAAPGDGTLSVRNADGQVRVTVRGAVIGKVERGWLTVVDPSKECDALLVWENDTPPREWTTADGETACTYRGTDLRFRFVGGLNELRVGGAGIYLSAVGKGTVRLKGTAGTYAVNGGRYTDLPLDWTREQIGVPVIGVPVI